MGFISKSPQTTTNLTFLDFDPIGGYFTHLNGAEYGEYPVNPVVIFFIYQYTPPTRRAARTWYKKTGR